MSWNAKEQHRYNNVYRNPKYGVSSFTDYTEYYPELIDRNLRVLDLGCGAAHLSKNYDDYTGIDISNKIIARNRKQLTGQYHVGSLFDLSRWYGQSYDVIFCNDVMEHVPTEMVGLVLKEISLIDAKHVYFKIHKGKSLRSDEQGNLHRTIKPHKWWAELIQNWFKIVDHIPRGRTSTYLSYFKVLKKS